MRVIVLTGRRFGRWVVLGKVVKPKGVYGVRWLCKCDCGTVAEVSSERLRIGKSKSCGCYRREWATQESTTHGGCGTEEYKIWEGMKKRCKGNDPCYGGRGIKVCGRWLGPDGFANFLADVGKRPSQKHSLDRCPDKDGDYQPGNVRWATAKEQANNRNGNVELTYKGITKTIAEWAGILGLTKGTLYSRYYKGWPVEKVLSTTNYKQPHKRIRQV